MAIEVRLRNGDGTFKADEADLSHIDTDFVANAGVNNIDTDLITTQDTGSNRKVSVSAGVVYIRNSAYSVAQGVTRYYSADVKDATLVDIDPNTTLATRVDYICAKFDSAVTPDLPGSNVATLVNVKGTVNNTAPTIPSNYEVIARLDLALNFTGVTNAMITDMRVQTTIDVKDSWTGIDKSEDPLAVSGTLAIVQYVSASSIKIYGDWRKRIGIGSKIKYTQSGSVKYHVITSAGSYSGGYTTYTIAVNTDYVMANAVITKVYYSNANPIDFPYWFNRTPVFSSSGSMTVTGATIAACKFHISERIVTEVLQSTTITTGGTAAGEIRVTPAVTPVIAGYGGGTAKDTAYRQIVVEANPSVGIRVQSDVNLSAWTLGSSREIYYTVVYQI